MENISNFCTCTHLDCPLHPTRHDKGCAPCIAKNLQTREMPDCFFRQIPDGDNRTDDSFETFAKLVLQAK